MSANAKLVSGSIGGHLIGQTAPGVFGVAAMMSIGLVDAYFIGQLGSAPLAAISFIFPIMIAMTSLGVGVMVGINSVVAMALGAGDTERAERSASFGIIFAAAIGLVISAFLYTLSDPLFRLMQADAETLPLIRAYIEPIALGIPLLLVIMGCNGVLRAQGEARKTLLVSLSYASANWVLDPILITGAWGFEGYGIVGAAWATVIGWGIGIGVAFGMLSRTALRFRAAHGLNRASGEAARSIVKVAGPAALSNAINPLGLAVLTSLVAIEGQAAVAGFGSAGRLQSFAVVPLLALSGSIGAIIGQNWGAGEPERAREAFRKAAGFCVVYGLAIAIILVLAADWFAGAFSDDPAVTSQFTAYLTIAAWGYAGYGLLIVSNGTLNAVGRAHYSLMQSAARVCLVMLPVAWIFLPSLGAQAIYTAELAANLIGGALAVFVAFRVLRQKRPAR